MYNNKHKYSIDPNHNKKRKFLRTAGIAVLALGIILLIIGLVDFFSAFNKPFGGGPKHFWINFIALPLIAVGGSMTAAGFAGAIGRYNAQEMAPVRKDTFNYMAQGTKEGVRTVAGAVREGLGRSDHSESITCFKCGRNNPTNSAFCNGCGSPLQAKKNCSACGFDNPHDSSFCNKCGSKL